MNESAQRNDSRSTTLLIAKVPAVHHQQRLGVRRCARLRRCGAEASNQGETAGAYY